MKDFKHNHPDILSEFMKFYLKNEKGAAHIKLRLSKRALAIAPLANFLKDFVDNFEPCFGEDKFYNTCKDTLVEVSQLHSYFTNASINFLEAFIRVCALLDFKQGDFQNKPEVFGVEMEMSQTAANIKLYNDTLKRLEKELNTYCD